MRGLLIAGLVTLLLMSLASADESLSDLFSNESDILPPTIGDAFEPAPRVEESAGYAMPTMALGEAKAEATAADMGTNGLYNLNLNIKDVNSGEPITDAHIRVYLSDGRQQTGTLRFVGSDGVMSLQLPPGTWQATLKLDITETPGKDYYSQFETILTTDRNLTAFMQPVGSVTGEVVDSDSNLVTSAEIKFDCSGDYGETSVIYTDQFGSFSADWLPIGTCKISALKGMVGSTEAIVSKGQVSSASIVLVKGVYNEDSDYTWLLIVALIVIIVVLGIFLMKRRAPTNVKEEPKEIRPDRRMSDMLSAMDENERKIVEYLLSCGGESLQNKIARELDFPKSSLSRALGGLEARHLVETEKLGRIKRVQLSQWFLNGKQS